jgi:hypothetical protein
VHNQCYNTLTTHRQYLQNIKHTHHTHRKSVGHIETKREKQRRAYDEATRVRNVLKRANVTPENLECFLKHSSTAREFAKILPTSTQMAKVWENTSKLCSEFPDRSEFKSTMLHEVYRGVPHAMVPTAACTGRELKRARASNEEPKRTSVKAKMATMRVKGPRTKVFPAITVSCAAFLFKESFVTSGSATTTRCISTSKEELYSNWRKTYATLLLSIHSTDPNFLNGSTILCKDIRTVLSGNHITPRWSVDEKRRKRKKKARKKRNFGRLPVSSGTIVVDCNDSENPQFTLHKALSDDGDDIIGSSSSSSDSVSECETEARTNWITPLSYRVFWRCIRNHRDEDNQPLRYKKIKKVHGCTTCLTASTTKQNYGKCNMELVKQNAAKPQNTMRILDARKNLAAAWEKWMTLCRHEKQYATQRGYLQQREALLAKRSNGMFQIIVYEDFVAMYNLLGRKVQDLVFTIVWRDENGVLNRKYVDNYCTDFSKSSDADYVINTWRMHLVLNKMIKEHKETKDGEEKTRLWERIRIHRASSFPNEFEGVTHVLRSGDSGSHFHNRLVFDWESEVHSMYGMIWETHNLCKRHAWNLCDSHGAQAKKGAHAAAMAGMAPETALEFATIINECRTGYGQARAYVIENINRSTKDKRWKLLKQMDGVKKCSEFQYWHLAADGTVMRTPGVVRMRHCSQNSDNHEDYITVLLRKSPPEWGNMCKKCTQFWQRPVFHVKNQDKCKLKVRYCL